LFVLFIDLALFTSTAAQYPENNTVEGARSTYGTAVVLQPSGEGCISAPTMTVFDVMNMAGTSAGVGQQSRFQTGYSRIFIGPSSVQDKDNQDPCHSPKWLHRNDNYVRMRHQVYGDSALQQSAEMFQDPGVWHLLTFLR